jgi:hypothetical protein
MRQARSAGTNTKRRDGNTSPDTYVTHLTEFQAPEHLAEQMNCIRLRHAKAHGWPGRLNEICHLPDLTSKLVPHSWRKSNLLLGFRSRRKDGYPLRQCWQAHEEGSNFNAIVGNPPAL